MEEHNVSGDLLIFLGKLFKFKDFLIEALCCRSTTKRDWKYQFYMTCVLRATHKVKSVYTKHISVMNTFKNASLVQSTTWNCDLSKR